MKHDSGTAVERVIKVHEVIMRAMSKYPIGVTLTIVRFSGALSNKTFHFADPPDPNPMTTPPLPEQIELHRDRMWRRDEDLRVESAVSTW